MVHRFFAAVGVLVSFACADQPVVSPLANTQPLLITSGNPDNGAHPYVGLLVFDNAQGPAWRCTGALISPTVVLTAGHCTDGAVAARIWMDEIVQGNTEYPSGGATSYEGAPFTYPGFCIVCGRGIGILNWLAGDVGVVVLSEPVPTSAVSSYVQLPAAGLADGLAKNAPIQLVGYGHQFRLVGLGPPSTAGFLVRLTTPATYISGQFSNQEHLLRLSVTASHDRGGACFGDSGGPNLVGSSHVTVAVNSYGTNGNCRGVSYSTRIDLPAILTWIQSFFP